MQNEDVQVGLTAEQRRQYEANGFLALEAYLDAETVAEMARAADDLLTSIGPIVPENPRIQADPIGNGYGIRQLWPVVDISPTFARLATDERILALFRSLFDGDTPVLFEDKLNYKQPGGGTRFPMHQDYSYWQPYSPRLTSAMIYIDEATEANGCLEVVPGWHKRGLLERSEMHITEQVTDHYIPGSVLDPGQAVKVSGPPGTVILFSCFTPHASAPNLSARPRRAFILSYNPARDGNAYAETSGANAARARAWLVAQRSRTTGASAP
ncbi:MAG TPA: phytanoyl-CoA dioxygenase family protein [Chthonomonadaceae bacterium]|jgi:ectoine hydroxylase-related dioxygenase (phytanoyl-CoA dioxygenase family)|nr:phytanoyl-CoA dioxygenase family protein [Chthonomonadaceae bacterium]